MLTIDLHTHILPERWPSWTQRSGYPGWIELQHTGPGCARMCRTLPVGGVQFFRDVQANLWDPSLRRAEMDASAVDIQVLSTVPVMFSHWAKPADAHDLHRLLNDHIAEVCRAAPIVHRPDAPALPRFIGLGVLPLQSPDLACRELGRCVRELHLRGVQIGTNINGLNLDDPALAPVFAMAESLDACVFVHPWDMLAPDRMSRYWTPWLVGMPTETTIAICSVLFGGMLERHPRLRVCFAHAGGSFPGTLGRISHGRACRPDLFPPESRDPREYLATPTGPARFWVDGLAHDADALRLVVKLFSARRVAMGSDYPFPLGEDRPGALVRSLEAELGAEAVASVLSGAAREFLGVSRGT